MKLLKRLFGKWEPLGEMMVVGKFSGLLGSFNERGKLFAECHSGTGEVRGWVEMSDGTKITVAPWVATNLLADKK
ncbi:hypothetical protein P6F34_gp34 [Pseudomonas phage MiCath]|uniref:Uncharacterized protein n=1 Tax=Pseudomonas phage MiCath TaxID=3003729 RepID=A0AAE9VJ48_9CAUD|nr:hypothetical protein P6F34_gp34 [Pseudomonas phage MiCath]WAX22386.1 hypothetical protein [Pseudomonas phage MiCath]